MNAGNTTIPSVFLPLWRTHIYPILYQKCFFSCYFYRQIQIAFRPVRLWPKVIWYKLYCNRYRKSKDQCYTLISHMAFCWQSRFLSFPVPETCQIKRKKSEISSRSFMVLTFHNPIIYHFKLQISRSSLGLSLVNVVCAYLSIYLCKLADWQTLFTCPLQCTMIIHNGT